MAPKVDLLKKYGEIAYQLMQGEWVPPRAAIKSMIDLYDNIGAFAPLNQNPFKSSAPAVLQRVPADRLDDILNSGEIKNRFQTKSSRGTNQDSLKREMEQALFGYDLKTEGKKRPKYGYLDLADKEGPSQYGGVMLKYAPSVNNRTTYTYGDSLDDVPLRGLLPPETYEDFAAARDL